MMDVDGGGGDDADGCLRDTAVCGEESRERQVKGAQPAHHSWAGQSARKEPKVPKEVTFPNPLRLCPLELCIDLVPTYLK